jgi:hypothetical protein
LVQGFLNTLNSMTMHHNLAGPDSPVMKLKLYFLLFSEVVVIVLAFLTVMAWWL